MSIQRICDAEIQIRNRLSNGPLRARGKCRLIIYRVWSDVAGRRYMPRVCLYPAKSMINIMNSRWHRG